MLYGGTLSFRAASTLSDPVHSQCMVDRHTKWLDCIKTTYIPRTLFECPAYIPAAALCVSFIVF
jgi:hypothetical protein